MLRIIYGWAATGFYADQYNSWLRPLNIGTTNCLSTMFYKDSASGMKYINTGAVAVPTWEAI